VDLAIAQDTAAIPECEFRALAGDAYQPFGEQVVDEWHAANDEMGDVYERTGRRATDPPRYLDATRLLWGGGRITPAIRDTLREHAPGGTAYSGYGDRDKPFPAGDVLFFAVTLAEALPATPPDGRSVLLFFGSDPNGKPGDNYAARVEVPHNPWNGIQRFAFGGAFSDGSSGAGAADMGKKRWAYHNVTVPAGIVYDPTLPGWLGWVPAKEVGSSFRVWVSSTLDEVTIEDVIGSPESELGMLPTDATTPGFIEGGSVFLHPGPFPKLLEITLVSAAFGALASQPLADITLTRGRRKLSFGTVAPDPDAPAGVLRYAVRIPAAGIYTLAGLGLVAAASTGSGEAGPRVALAGSSPRTALVVATSGGVQDLDGDGTIDTLDVVMSRELLGEQWRGVAGPGLGGSRYDLGIAGGDLAGDHSDGRTGYDPVRDGPCDLWTPQAMRDVVADYLLRDTVVGIGDPGPLMWGQSPDGSTDYCVLRIGLEGGGEVIMGHNQENAPITIDVFDRNARRIAGETCELAPYPDLEVPAYLITCPPDDLGPVFGLYALLPSGDDQFGNYFGINALIEGSDDQAAAADAFSRQALYRMAEFKWATAQ
jgi:hypothetical protein